MSSPTSRALKWDSGYEIFRPKYNSETEISLNKFCGKRAVPISKAASHEISKIAEQHDELLPDLRSGHTPQRAPTY